MKTFVIILFCSLIMVISTNIIQEKPPSNADIICPDAVSVCPTTSTCCIATDATYSCCPIAEGVCCSDHIHCCPHHYKCDLKIFKCDRVFDAKMLEVKPALNKN